MTEQNSQPFWRPTRESLEETYRFGQKIGAIPPVEEEALHWKNLFAEFELCPPDNLDWNFLAKELRFIELEEAEHPRHSTLGNAELAKRFLVIGQKLEELGSEFIKLTYTTAGLLAERELQRAGKRPPSGSIFGWALRAKNLAALLTETPQKPRWREKSIRHANIALAFKLADLFELCFSKRATPVSGGEYRELQETNDWTRFFQVVSYAFYGLKETADRQGVLWAASKLRKQLKSDTPPSSGS